jgi:hypothetical protein
VYNCGRGRIVFATSWNVMCKFSCTKKVNGGIFATYLMFKYGLKCVEKEREGANIFSGIMNIPPTIAQIDK